MKTKANVFCQLMRLLIIAEFELGRNFLKGTFT